MQSIVQLQDDRYKTTESKVHGIIIKYITGTRAVNLLCTLLHYNVVQAMVIANDFFLEV